MDKVKRFLFKNSGVRQTIVKNIVWLSAGVAVSRIIRSLMIIYAARALGVEHYGIFSYALSLSAVFNIFSDIGLTTILTRELVTKKEGKKEFLSTTLSIKLLLILITTAFIAFVAPTFTKIEEAKDVIMVVSLLIAFDSIRSFIFSIYRSENRMQFEGIFEIITEFFITTIGFIIIYNYPSVLNLSIGYTVASGLSLILTLILTKKYLTRIFRHIKTSLIKPIIRSAWPFAIVGVFGVLMTNIDSVIIGHLLPISDLGLYAAAQKPIGLISLLPGFIYAGLFPFFSQYTNDEEKTKLLMKKSITISVGLALPIVIGGLIIADPLIRVMYGSEYTGSIATFQVLLLSMLAIFPGTVLSGILIAKDQQKIFAKATAFGAFINVALDLTLIPNYGIVGSAIATLVVQFVVNMIYFAEIRKNNNLITGYELRKILTSTLIMGIGAFVMKILLWPIFYIVLLSSVIFLTSLILQKEEILEDVALAFKK